MGSLFQFFMFVTPIGLFLLCLERSERHNPTITRGPWREKFLDHYSGPVLFWGGIVWAFCLGRFFD